MDGQKSLYPVATSTEQVDHGCQAHSCPWFDDYNPSKMDLHDLEDEHVEEEFEGEEDPNKEPSPGRKVVNKLQAAVDWYGATVHPYVQSVKAPITYIMWCLLTTALIAGLPTVKAISSDPYTELGLIIQEQEAQQRAQPKRIARQ